MNSRAYTAKSRIAAMASCLVLLGLSACGGGSEDDGEVDNTIKIAALAPSPESGIFEMATEQGYYDKYGVNVEIVTVDSAQQGMPAVVSGQVDILIQGPGPMFLGAENGEIGAKIIGSAAPGMNFVIYCKEGLQLEDINGKRLAISSPTGGPALIANAMLDAAGIDRAQVEYVNAGGNTDRYRAVVQGNVEFAVTPQDYIPRAEADGVDICGTSQELIPEYPRLAIIASDKILADRPQIVEAYLAGFIEGIHYGIDHLDEAKELAVRLMTATTETDKEVINFILDETEKYKLIDRNADIMQNRWEYLHDTMVTDKTLKQPLDNLGDLFDDSYRQGALQLIANK